jgi:hypothetical protein
MLAAYGILSLDLPPSCVAPAVSIRSVVNFYGPSDLTSLYDASPSPAYIHDALQQYIGGPVAQFAERYKMLSPVTHVGAKSPPTITVLGLSDRLLPR